MSQTLFDELQQTLAAGGVPATFDCLTTRLRADRKYHELFDARLMQSRWRLGLPVILTTSLDDLPEPARTQIEDAYLEACREVGALLLAEGKVREAWMYLRPVGDKASVAAALENIEPADEQVEELIDVALHQGVSPRLGFGLVLKNYGTCNAITMFDSTMHERPRSDRQEVAELLIAHLHDELLRNLQAEITRQEGAPPRESTIAGLVADRDWLFADDNYHIDTSHLGAVVRFARLVESAPPLRLAVDLTEYGRRLSRQYQFAGEEPFVDAYPDAARFFRAQLGEEVEAALAFFSNKARSISVEEQGTGAAEVYIALLARLGRYDEAIEAMAQLIPPGARTGGFAPTLGELAKAAGRYEQMNALCRQRGDLLGFTASLIEGSGAV